MKTLNLIFDTDLGSDCDDVMALTYLIYAKRHLNVDIKAVTHCHSTPYGIPVIRSFFDFFDEDTPPVGRMEGGAQLKDHYCKEVADAFAFHVDYDPAPAAVPVLRRALAECNDGKCVICAVGQFTNIAALLLSKGDDISPLDGISLVRERCERLVIMAGKLADGEDGKRGADWNIRWDVPSAKTLFDLSPVPIYMLPSETGKQVISGKAAVDKYGDKTPLSLAFQLFFDARNGRSSWDPMTAVYAVEGAKDFLSESETGRILMDGAGVTYFEPTPNGNVTVLTLKRREGMTEQECREAVAAYVDSCAESVLSTCEL